MNSSARIGTLLGRKGRDIWAIQPDASVYHAIALMAEREVGALLVMADGRLEGIVSERDYTRKVVLQGRSSKQTAVRDIMTSPAVVASPDDSVAECMRMMTEFRVRHLPVIENNRVTGVISIGDLVKWTISAQEQEIRDLHQFIAGGYPG